MFRREIGERSCQRLRMLALRGSRSRDEAEPRIARFTAQCAGAGPVDCAVDDDAMQPRAERPATVETVEPADGCEERLLCNVLGGAGVVDDEIRRTVGTRPVVSEQRFEVGDRSRLCAPNPGALVAS